MNAICVDEIGREIVFALINMPHNKPQSGPIQVVVRSVQEFVQMKKELRRNPNSRNCYTLDCDESSSFPRVAVVRIASILPENRQA